MRKPTSDPERSALMARVRQQGTAPELVVRSLLTEFGARYRVNVKNLPGSPDIANQRARKAIFVHGCYWHRHPGCPKTTTPTRNREFWLAKFQVNQERDARKEAELLQAGFDVLVVWACEVQNPGRLRHRLHAFWSRSVS